VGVSPPSFPRTFPCPGASFPSRGPSGRFPRFLGTVKHSDFLPALPPHFVSFARWYRRCALSFVPAAARRNNCEPRIAYRTPPQRIPWQRRQELPCSWRTRHERAVLFDPGGILTLGHYRASMLPPLSRQCRLSRLLCFLGSITRPTHSLSTLRSMDCSITTQDSLPDGWPALPGGVGYSLGPNERFQVILPPFPGFAWRTENDISGDAQRASVTGNFWLAGDPESG
jgi:hypothetical protein